MIFRIGLCTVLLAASALPETTFEAIRKKPLWPNANGTLAVTEEGIEFRREDPEDSHKWTYQDIQRFDRVSPSEIAIVTYEDVAWQLGRDRSYRFTLVSGAIDEVLFQQIVSKIGLPATDRVVADVPEDAPRLPVKQLKRFGGSEGELVFGDAAISYVTDAPRQSRRWQIDREVESIWAQNRYELEIHIFEAGRRDFSTTRIYRFELKEPLDPELYRGLKLRLYDLRAEERVIP